MAEWSFRLAEPTDAPAFAQWTASNPQIDPADIQAAQKAQNPTVLYFVVTKDGVPVAFAPVYVAAVLAHLGFDPLSSGKDRLKALGVLKDGVVAFMTQYGVREVQTLSKPDYGVAKWALAHGFEMDGRNLFKLDVNREMQEVAS